MRLGRLLHVLCPLAAACILPLGPAWPQAEKRLSAREIFYSAAVETPAAKQAGSSAGGEGQEEEDRRDRQGQDDCFARNTLGDSPGATSRSEVIPVSYSPGAASPLGLRYSILKREGAESTEVDPDTVFRSGDRIRLRVEANGGGYLYIIHRGSSGVWKPLFPSSEIAGGDNRVQKGKPYEIPPGYVFTFDEQPGDERLFIVLSRQPEADLEGLIYSLSSGQKPAELAAPKRGKGAAGPEHGEHRGLHH